MVAEGTLAVVEETVVVFVHSAGKECKPVRASSLLAIREVISLAAVETPEGTMVFVGECATDIECEDDVDDNHDAVDVDDPIHKHLHGRHIHIHCHRCHRLEVTVHFENKSKRRKFSPARTVAEVRHWALHQFKLTDAAADKLVLEICDSDKRPRPEEHLGELSSECGCELCFSLQQSVAPQG